MAFVFHTGMLDERDDLWISRRSPDGAAFDPGTRFRSALNSLATEAQPTLSADGQVIVFSSDREGSLGQLDLWMSTRLPKWCSRKQEAWTS